MKTLKLTFFAALFLAVSVLRAADAAQVPAGLKTRNVIILVQDGERYTETWGDPKHTHKPLLAKELAPQGILLTQFFNQGRTDTNPGHATICTGVYQDISNDGKTLPKNPVIFQAFRKAADAPATDAWVLVSKDKLTVLADSGAPAWQGQFTASVKSGKADADTMKAVFDALGRDHPRLMIVNLAAPDAMGHSGNWEAYLAAVKACDDYAAQLWRFIQKNPAYADATALIVTNDHGRHTDDFKSHGCKCEGCRHLLFCALGPDFKKGAVSDQPAEQIDIAPTVAALLHFPLPDAKGRVLTELFQAAGAVGGGK